jgi:hypothetical protein
MSTRAGASVTRPEFLEEACDVVATLPAACRTFDAQHVEPADETADRSVGWRAASLAENPRKDPLCRLPGGTNVGGV